MPRFGRPGFAAALIVAHAWSFTRVPFLDCTEKGAELSPDALAQTGVSFADSGNLAGYSKVAFPVKLNPVSDGECSLSVVCGFRDVLLELNAPEVYRVAWEISAASCWLPRP